MSATNRGKERQPQDAYQTPQWCVDRLFGRLNWPKVKSFCEPCRGDGHVYNAVPKRVRIKQWAEIKEGVDYLATKLPTVDLIVTNPPYKDAEAFLEKSLREGRTVIYLLRVNYLGSRKRLPFWEEHPPTHLLMLSTRPSFEGGGTDATEYAWICWDRRGIVKGPVFQWLAK